MELHLALPGGIVVMFHTLDDFYDPLRNQRGWHWMFQGSHEKRRKTRALAIGRTS